MDGPKQDKRYPQNQGLKKKVYSHSDYPDLFYIRYLGDRGLSKGFCHQNSKTTAKQRVDFARTNPKVLAEIRKAKGNPLKIYGQMTNKKEGDCEEHAINTVRDEEQQLQVTNTQFPATWQPGTPYRSIKRK